MIHHTLSPIRVPDLRAGYCDIVRDVRRYGRKREARGFAAWDVGDAVFTVEDTRKLMPYGVGRAVKEEIGYCEALLLVAGVESPSLLTAASGTFRRFMDGGALAGSYGPLTRSQMPHVVETLRGDRDSRQAVVQVHPGLQNVQGLRDVPCTINLGFELRDDGLHMRATMRSNDVWLGLCYDAFMFGQLGWSVANCLGVELKTYTHHAYSLHLYERDEDKIDFLTECVVDFDEPSGIGLVISDSQWEGVRRRAEMIYELDRPGCITDSEMAYEVVTAKLGRLTRTDGFAS